MSGLLLTYYSDISQLQLVTPVMDSPLVNPVLAYVKAFRLRGDLDSLKHVALGKFATALLAEAKRILWDKCSLSSLGLPLTSRRTTEKRSQAAADLEDIIAAFAKLDDNGSIPMIFCEASDLVLLPPIVTDPVCEMVHENSRSLRGLENEIKELSSKFDKLNAVISKVEGSLSQHSAESYASVTRSSPQIAQARISSPLSGNLMPTYASRSHKLILFGLPEHNTLAELKNEIDKILSFLVGSHVPLSDLYRLGRKKSGTTTPLSRPRPVLLTFTSLMDRRLVLSRVRKLKEYDTTGLYLRPDLSIDERVKRRSGNPSSSNPQPPSSDSGDSHPQTTPLPSDSGTPGGASGTLTAP